MGQAQYPMPGCERETKLLPSELVDEKGRQMSRKKLRCSVIMPPRVTLRGVQVDVSLGEPGSFRVRGEHQLLREVPPGLRVAN